LRRQCIFINAAIRANSDDLCTRRTLAPILFKLNIGTATNGLQNNPLLWMFGYVDDAFAAIDIARQFPFDHFGKCFKG
jgi:hypothetical protein